MLNANRIEERLKESVKVFNRSRTGSARVDFCISLSVIAGELAATIGRTKRSIRKWRGSQSDNQENSIPYKVLQVMIEAKQHEFAELFNLEGAVSDLQYCECRDDENYPVSQKKIVIPKIPTRHIVPPSSRVAITWETVSSKVADVIARMAIAGAVKIILWGVFAVLGISGIIGAIIGAPAVRPYILFLLDKFNQ